MEWPEGHWTGCCLCLSAVAANSLIHYWSSYMSVGVDQYWILTERWNVNFQTFWKLTFHWLVKNTLQKRWWGWQWCDVTMWCDNGGHVMWQYVETMWCENMIQQCDVTSYCTVHTHDIQQHQFCEIFNHTNLLNTEMWNSKYKIWFFTNLYLTHNKYPWHYLVQCDSVAKSGASLKGHIIT